MYIKIITYEFVSLCVQTNNIYLTFALLDLKFFFYGINKLKKKGTWATRKHWTITNNSTYLLLIQEELCQI